MELRPHSIVAEVLFDGATRRASGVRVIDALTGESREYHARVVFLCASALETVRLLLNSRSPETPAGLGNAEDLLGRYLLDHHYGAGASATMPGYTKHRAFGNRPNGFYIARFRNVATSHGSFLRGYGVQGGAMQAGWKRGVTAPGFGAAFKDALLRERGEWGVYASGYGETLPHRDNRLTLDPERVDRWGVAAARIDVRWRDNEVAMSRDMAESVAEMFEAAGCTDVQPFRYMPPPGHCVHEMGGARMGRTPRDGVVNCWNQVWEAPNVFVTDGACMASSACQNPSLTYMAMTARSAAFAVEALKRGEL